MKELPLHIQRAIRDYQPVTVDGLTLYPVLVKEYDQFQMARPALEVLHQSLPVRLLRMPLLSALYRMDYEAVSDGKPATGLFSAALLALALSLRLGEGLEAAERTRRFRVLVDREEPGKLLGLRCLVNGEEQVDISPAQFGELRPILAAQNGVKLESDQADPELVKSERDQAGLNGISLNATLEDLLSSVAALSGVDEAEMEEWPLLKLQRRERSYRRILDYLICSIGQVNGTTWKGGNPHPHPFFDRSESGGFGAHMALGNFAGGAGKRAVESAGQST